MNNFKRNNIIVGWVSFAIAMITYILTIEPSASLWDCSEFIATSFKLEVGHPPGAPLFMMISRLFAIFAPDVTKVAVMINAMSATASAFTILFLFWSITHIARKLYEKNGKTMNVGQMWAVLGAGFIGATAYTFTDTFWFSAVEGEVYGLSSFFTAIVFWAILKWEDIADEPHSNRWLILIAYLTGLAIGVHLLNLLVLPAVALIYYFRKSKQISSVGIIKALAVSGVVLIAVMFIIIPGTISLGAGFDRFFVNTLGLPINMGITFYAFAVFALLGYGIYYTHKKGHVILNTIMLCLSVVVLGYSSYASVLIRSSVNPPMNSNGPTNPYSLLSLLNRDQYGARPLVTGPVYSSPPVNIEYKDAYYVGDDGKYQKGQTVKGYVYDPEFKFFFPRMHSSQQRDIEAYQSWVDIQGQVIPFQGQAIEVPTFGDNFKFFMSYQLNFMYWRYFLWNFVGRQSDVQSTGQLTDGNWLSGIKFIDEAITGPQDDLPYDLENNKGRNKYYFLPLLLGLIGLIFQLNRDGKNFSVVAMLFFMTGIAITIYLNSPPVEPRERDYVFAGSFYAFAIWIGLGVLGVYDAISGFFKKNDSAAAILATVACLCVPAILFSENLDDHNRSGRYVARDFGQNYLNSTLPNAIIMNYGDNDTFPLWYSQEVEDVRTDVRVMNMSYLGGEWYIDQMKLKSNKSEALPFSLPRSKYTYNNEFLLIEDVVGQPVDIKQVMAFIISDKPETKISLGDRQADYIPTNKITIPVNKKNVIESGIVSAKDSLLIEDTITLNITKSNVDRSEMMLLDLLANFDWKRPIYFTQTHTLDALGLRDYMQYDGFAFRLVPIKTPTKSVIEVGRIDTEHLYDLLMNTFKYGNIADPKVYADHFIQTTFNAAQTRTAFARLAKQLIAEGDTVRAVEVLDRCLEVIPYPQIGHTYALTIPLIEAYYMAGEADKANEILVDYATLLKQKINYVQRFDVLPEQEFREHISMLYELYTQAARNAQKEISADIEKFFGDNNIL
ncbi:MAG: DUF2723 domain-containing protein [Rikenellaceae bacterium]